MPARRSLSSSRAKAGVSSLVAVLAAGALAVACGAAHDGVDPLGPDPTGSDAGFVPGVDGSESSEDDSGLSATPPGSKEICGNGLDDDGNGEVDEGCPCSVSAMQKCYGGDKKLAGVGVCKWGTQTCEKTGEFGAWGKCTGWTPPGKEACDGKLDENCDGKVDEGCPPPKPDAGPPDVGAPDAGDPCLTTVKIDIDGDCVTASCPKSAPYPVGCSIKFIGGTPCGCIASTPTSSTVFFKEGKVCDAGHLTGTLNCSCKPGTGLNPTNCPILDKTYKYYPKDKSGCPDGSCPI